MGKQEVELTKKALGWPSLEPFFVPEEALALWRRTLDRGHAAHEAWHAVEQAYRTAYPQAAAELARRIRGELPEGWDSTIPTFTAENGAIASRAASGAVLNAIAARVPELMGGSADLAPSNNTTLAGVPAFSPGNYAGRNMHFGVREHGMGSIMNGMSLHGGVMPYGGTFLIFSDYMRPPMRLAALMHRHVIYVYTHDSIGLGEDGPTHQPVEQLSALRAIPGFTLIRPADANETAEAWRVAMTQRGPVALVLTRQKLGYIDRVRYGSAAGLARGAYVLADPQGGPPEVVLLSSGSEVGLVLQAQTELAAEGVRARVVSMPSHELFARQARDYRDEVLPPGIPRVAMEAAHPMSWYQWVGLDGIVIGITRFGASAPYQRIYEELGLTVAHVVAAAKQVVGR